MTSKTDTHPRRVASYMNSGFKPYQSFKFVCSWTYMYVHRTSCILIYLTICFQKLRAQKFNYKPGVYRFVNPALSSHVVVVTFKVSPALLNMHSDGKNHDYYNCNKKLSI